MSEGWIPKNLKTKIMKTDVQTYKKSQKTLTDEQKAKVKEVFRSAYAEEYEKPLKERKVYKDAFGGYIMILKTPKDLDVREDKTGRGYFFAYNPLLEEDVMVFMSLKRAKAIEKNSPLVVILRGWASAQYRDLGSEEYHVEEKAYLKEKDASNIKDLDSDTFDRRHRLTVWEYITAFR